MGSGGRARLELLHFPIATGKMRVIGALAFTSTRYLDLHAALRTAEAFTFLGRIQVYVRIGFPRIFRSGLSHDIFLP
jgi:hypothetical protein